MSKFDELHQYLQSQIEAEGRTEDDIEFKFYAWPFALSIEAKKEHDRLVEENKRLREALICMTERYCDLINSGDAGNWNPEEDEAVISARLALQELEASK